MTNQQHVPEGSVIITPGEVYSRVTALTDAVQTLLARDAEDERRRVEEREAAARRDSERREEIARIETRLSSVERKLWIASGFAAALGGTVGANLGRLLQG